MHVQEDHFLAEVIHPATLEPLPPGAVGELVLTTLTREAMPLVRYRTGDLTSLTHEPCACGRTTARMRSVFGRRSDAFTTRGVRLYPSLLEQALLEQPGVALAYQLVAERGDIAVHCEPLDPFTDRVALAEQVRAALRDRVGLDLRVVVEAPGALPRSPGKATRFIHQ
jgi:phenylacetate-CoA ligase